MKKQILSLAAASLITFSVQANDLSYNFAEVGYTQSSFDIDAEGDSIDSLINDIDPSGIYFKGSVALSDSVFAFGSYETVSGDGTTSDSYSDTDYSYQLGYNLDLDYSLLRVGFGYNYAIADNSHMLIKLGYLTGQIKGDTLVTYNETYFGESYSDTFNERFDYDDNGYSIGLGYRGLISEKLELNGEISYVKFDESDTVFDIGGAYFFTPQHSVTLSGAFFEDQSDLKIGYRYNF